MRDLAICDNMDGPRKCYVKWSMTDRKSQIWYEFIYMWNLKKQNKWTNQPNKQTLKQTHSEQRINWWLAEMEKGKMGEREWEILSSSYGSHGNKRYCSVEL